MSAVDVHKPPLIVAAVRALRPKQWTKNGALLAPLIFAKSIFAHGLALRALAAVGWFSLLASGVYVVNDWFDRDKDRLHPEKKKRPIAAGHLSGAMAIVLRTQVRQLPHDSPTMPAIKSMLICSKPISRAQP